MFNKIEAYLRDNKELKVNFDIHLLDLALRDVRLEQGYFPGEAIAKGLGLVSSTLSPNVSHFFINNMNRDIESYRSYYLGFNDLSFLIQNAFSVFAEGYETTMIMLSWYQNNESFLYLANKHLLSARTMLGNDRSAIQFVDTVVSQELENPTLPFFYKIGMLVLRNVYSEYITAFETILPNIKYADSKTEENVKTVDIYPSLMDNKKKSTIPLPRFNSIAKANNQVDSSNSMDNEMFFEQLIPIRQLQYKEEATIKDLLQQIAYWRQFTSNNALKKHSAVFSSICLTSSDVAFDIYRVNSEKKYLYEAIDMLTKSLDINVIWESELGTRCINSFRLGTLLSENIGNLENSSEDIAKLIRETYKDCLQSNERLFQRSLYWESKERFQSRMDLAVARILEADYFLSKNSRFDASLSAYEIPILSETMKSRFLRLEMSISAVKPPDSIPLELTQTESNLLLQLRNVVAELLSRQKDQVIKENTDQKDKELKELYMGLESIWAKMEFLGRDEIKSYVSFRRDDILSLEIHQEWNQIKTLLSSIGPKIALVSIRRLPESIMFSIIKSDLESPVNLIVPLSRESFYEYMNSYDNEILNRNNPAFQYFKTQETRKWQELGEVLFAPIEPFINNCELIYFIPHASFHQIPLHAMKLHGVPLITKWKVVYSPSINVLKSTLNRRRTVGKPIIIGCYEYEDSESLKKAIFDEAKWVASYNNGEEYIQSEAVSDVLYEKAENSRIIHLACHGYYNPDDPLGSGVILQSGLFTARDWLRLKLQSELVVLSTCKSGINKIGGGDNIVGLMRSILFAGSSSLLLTLWDVDSLSASKWMKTFYKSGWSKDGEKLGSKAAAFQKATLELMFENDDPYYWSPFILTGDYS